MIDLLGQKQIGCPHYGLKRLKARGNTGHKNA
jgi:hypothetical protein